MFGFPITAAANERNADTGTTSLTQWFERARLELHPENARPYDVLLGRIGDERLRRTGVRWQTLPPEPGPIPDPGCLWFPQTGHNVCDQIEGQQFKSYWQRHGVRDRHLDGYGRSLALFGLPLTEVRWETTSSGYFVLTQWFERARLEWHPDRPTRPRAYTVVLGRLGVELHVPPERARPGDLQRARATLQAFFTALNTRRYAAAVERYGGDYAVLRGWNSNVAADEYAALWRGGCEANGLQCLRTRRVVSESVRGPRAFRFVVEFAKTDGSLFVRRPCCGATEEDMPSQSQWDYVVTRIGDQFLVQGSPVYVP